MPNSELPPPKVKAAIGPMVKSCLKSYLSHNLKATEANFKSLHKKIKHDAKACCIQDFMLPRPRSRSLLWVKVKNIFLQLLENH